MKKPYFIKYKFIWYHGDNRLIIDESWTKRYKTEKSRDEALKDMKRKGHIILEYGVEGRL